MSDLSLDRYPLRAEDVLRYADTDRQGHVNNAVFATFLETGRVALLYDPARPLAAADCSFVLVRLELDLLAEVNWPGTVAIGTRVLRIGRSSVHVQQALFQDGRQVARATSVVVHVRAGDGGVPLSAAARDRLETLSSVT